MATVASSSRRRPLIARSREWQLPIAKQIERNRYPRCVMPSFQIAAGFHSMWDVTWEHEELACGDVDALAPMKWRRRQRPLLQAVAASRIEKDDGTRSSGERGVVNHAQRGIAVSVRRVLATLSLHRGPGY